MKQTPCIHLDAWGFCCPLSGLPPTLSDVRVLALRIGPRSGTRTWLLRDFFATLSVEVDSVYSVEIE